MGTPQIFLIKVYTFIFFYTQCYCTLNRPQYSVDRLHACALENQEIRVTRLLRHSFTEVMRNPAHTTFNDCLLWNHLSENTDDAWHAAVALF